MQALAVTLSALLVAQAPLGPLAPDSQPADCWVHPLRVSLGEMAMMGGITDQYVRSHCQRWIRGDFASRSPRPMAIAGTRLFDFRLFGEQLSFGFDVVVRPGAIGRNDDLYVSPALDLPEAWERALDQATYPALAIAGTAIITAIILKALK